jgi:signal transduction histidine kinase
MQLNQTLAPICVSLAGAGIIVIPAYPSAATKLFVLILVASFLLALVLNRRPSIHSATLLTIITTVGIITLTRSHEAMATLTTPTTVPGELFVPIIIAALFIAPRTSILISVLMSLALSLKAWLVGCPLDAIFVHSMLTAPTIIAMGVLAAVGAGQFHRALTQIAAANVVLEQRVAERTRELAEAKAALERRAELRVHEVTGIVHDARNQIGHIRAATELLVDEVADFTRISPTAARAQHIISDSLIAQQEMLDALLEAALLEAGALVLRPSVLDVRELLERVIEQSRPRYDQRRCALVLAPGDPIAAVCDERRVARVIRNLLHNALIYTAPHRPGSGMVRVNLAREEELVVIQITDNGVGIDAAQLNRLGERFVRAAEGRGMPEGSGIGLNTSIGIVALHGGTLRLFSAGIGHGATAEIRLPLGGLAQS